MQYTLRNIPPEVDRALRRRAKEEGRSLNEVAVDVLKRALGLTEQQTRQRDLGDIAGTWEEDAATDAALQDQRRIDADAWR